MGWLDFIGYYSPFPEAIPLCKAGYSRVTHPFATNPLKFIPKKSSKFHRSTCMCYARRQRLSWARIKLSIKVWSWLLSIFRFWFTQSNSLYFSCSFYIFFWGSMSLSRNDYYIIPRSFYLVKYFLIFLLNLYFRDVFSEVISYTLYTVFFSLSSFLKILFLIFYRLTASLTVPLYNTRIFYLCQIFFLIF